MIESVVRAKGFQARVAQAKRSTAELALMLGPHLTLRRGVGRVVYGTRLRIGQAGYLAERDNRLTGPNPVLPFT